MNWFYYDNGEKKGAVNDAQLKFLATNGIIKRETMIETEDGRATAAQNIKGLFTEPPTQKFNNEKVKEEFYYITSQGARLVADVETLKSLIINGIIKEDTIIADDKIQTPAQNVVFLQSAFEERDKLKRQLNPFILKTQELERKNTEQFIEYRRYNKATAILLAIFLGGIGIHKFYMGKIAVGILYLLFCWTGIPLLLSLVDIVMLLTSEQEKNNMNEKDIAMAILYMLIILVIANCIQTFIALYHFIRFLSY